MKKYAGRRKYTLFAVIILIITSLFVGILALKHEMDEPEVDNDIATLFRPPTEEVFEPVLPDNSVTLPFDFRFHNEFQHEWWHFFANVVDKNGREYGVQWSFFRIANDDRERTGWLSSQLFIAHIVVSNRDSIWKEQRLSRGGIGQAGMTNKPFRVWIDNWFWRSLGATPFPGQLLAETDQFSVDLRVAASGPFVLPGERGYVNKHDLLPVASYNLTAPFLKVNGWLDIGENQPVAVKGKAWMSKEWGTGLLAEGQQGWDWFVLHLDDETTLSVNQYRHQSQLPHLFGTLATNDGKVIPLTPDDFSIQPIGFADLASGKSVPNRWQISVPAHQIDVTVDAVNSRLWLPFVIPYWEGPVKVSGTHKATGFMQMTGY